MLKNLDGFIQIAAFDDHNLAALIRSRLESEGIEVRVPFEYTGALRIPFVCATQNLYVREEDVHLARELLEGGHWTEEDLLPDEEFSEEPGPGDPHNENSLHCPNCRTGNLRLLPAPLWPSFVALILPGYSLDSVPSRWHCLTCDHVWQD